MISKIIIFVVEEYKKTVGCRVNMKTKILKPLLIVVLISGLLIILKKSHDVDVLAQQLGTGPTITVGTVNLASLASNSILGDPSINNGNSHYDNSNDNDHSIDYDHSNVSNNNNNNNNFSNTAKSLIEPGLAFKYSFNKLELNFGPGLTEFRFEPTEKIQLVYSGWHNNGYSRCDFWTGSNSRKSACDGFKSNDVDSMSSEILVGTLKDREIFYYQFSRADGAAQIQYQIKVLKRSPGRIFKNTKHRTLDPHCFSDPQYDACIFWKNPVASRGKAYEVPIEQNCTNCALAEVPLQTNANSSQNVSLSTNSGVSPNPIQLPIDLKYTEQFFPVKFNGKQRLTSIYDSFYFLKIGTNEIPQENTKNYLKNPKVTFGNSLDQNLKFSAAMVYYWLTQLENEFISHDLTFYVRGKKIPISLYDKSEINNARFSYSLRSNSEQINIGIMKDEKSVSEVPMALNAEVFIHEMGHANHWFAVLNKFGYNREDASDHFSDSSESNYNMTYCNPDGCLEGLKEGIADIHAVLMFKDKPSFFETMCNRYNLANANTNTNTNTNLSDTCIAEKLRDNTSSLSIRLPLSAYQINNNNIEINAAGGFYSAMLWRIAAKFEKKYSIDGWNDFRAIFVRHLSNVYGSGTFRDAGVIFRNAILSELSDFKKQAVYKKIVEEEFEASGILLPIGQ